jgi:hypothetical protein
MPTSAWTQPAIRRTGRLLQLSPSFPLLLRLFQPNILEPVVDIKAVVASFVVEIRLVAAELFGRFFPGPGSTAHKRRCSLPTRC